MKKNTTLKILIRTFVIVSLLSFSCKSKKEVIVQNKSIIDNEFNNCSLNGLFHSDDSALFKIVDTIKVEGYLVEYYYCHINYKHKNFLKRKLISDRKDTIRILDAILFYYDTTDININLDNLDKIDSVLHFPDIDYFLYNNYMCQSYVRNCQLDTVIENYHVLYTQEEFYEKLYYYYYEQDYKSNIQSIRWDSSEYQKVIYKKREFNIYLFRASVNFLRRGIGSQRNIFYDLEKDGWLYFGIPILTVDDSNK